MEVYGIGSSAPIAMDAYYRFLRIGLKISLLLDPHMQVVSAAQLQKGDVALAISHTGRSHETLSAAQKAKAAGATVISLSSFMQSPLALLADISLVTATAENAFRVEAMASRIAHLSVIDSLYVALAIRRFDEASGWLEQSSSLIEEKYQS
ncbi:MAG: SIS domain-containing protein [Deinococcales bacterium]